MNIQEKLAKIQQSLVISKGQRNAFGNYNYRSCEDILEAVKPLLGGLTLLIDDVIVNIGDRFYVKATATLWDSESDMIHVHAFARESLSKKGMDEAQITGAASSYARKYALNGLFAIDDTKDPDTMDNRYKAAQEVKKGNNELTQGTKEWNKAVRWYQKNGNLDGVKETMSISQENEDWLINYATYHGLLMDSKSILFAKFCEDLDESVNVALFNSFEEDKVKNKERVSQLTQNGVDHILRIQQMIDGTDPDGHEQIYADERVGEEEIEIIENWQRG